MSHECFLSGHCQQLTRAKNKACDSGMSKTCGPIDPAYPGRWYMPCRSAGTPTAKSTGKESYVKFGPGTIQYEIPTGFECERCVLQWYWVAANACNAPGVVDYFKGEHGPKTWGNCPGQGEATGGY